MVVEHSKAFLFFSAAMHEFAESGFFVLVCVLFPCRFCLVG